jgi:pyruvate carboxylase
MEVNPRVQVEHTITEEITGIDIVQSQIMIASGKTLDEIGLTQDSIQEPTSYAMQCRVVSRDYSYRLSLRLTFSIHCLKSTFLYTDNRKPISRL